MPREVPSGLRAVFVAGHATHAYISYSREDAAFATLIEAELADHGHTVWRDTKTIEGDADWETAIKNGLADAYAYVVIASQAAMGSDWVAKEITDARIPIVAARIETCELPDESPGSSLLSSDHRPTPLRRRSHRET